MPAASTAVRTPANMVYAEHIESSLKEQQSVNSAKPSTSSLSTAKAPEETTAQHKFLQGFYAICPNCGFRSYDHSKCQRCKRVFLQPPKKLVIKRPSSMSGNVDSVSNSSPASSAWPSCASSLSMDNKRHCSYSLLNSTPTASSPATIPASIASAQSQSCLKEQQFDNSAKRSTSSLSTCTTLEEPSAQRKFLQGFYAICPNCGFRSYDHSKCQRCKRVFLEPPNILAIKQASSTFGNVNGVSNSSPASSDSYSCASSLPMDNKQQCADILLNSTAVASSGAKFHKGFYGICPNCGFRSLDHSKCGRCKRVFLEPPKKLAIKQTSSSSGIVSGTSNSPSTSIDWPTSPSSLSMNKADAILTTSRRSKSSVNNANGAVGPRGSQGARGHGKRSGRRPAEVTPVILILSSDEEDECHKGMPNVR